MTSKRCGTLAPASPDPHPRQNDGWPSEEGHEHSVEAGSADSGGRRSGVVILHA